MKMDREEKLKRRREYEKAELDAEVTLYTYIFRVLKLNEVEISH